MASQGDSRLEFFSTIQGFYESGLFCDVKFICGIEDNGSNSISCHSCVLATALPSMIVLLEESYNEDGVIHCPDFLHDFLKKFIDQIYSLLGACKNYEVYTDQTLPVAFGLLKKDCGTQIEDHIIEAKTLAELLSTDDERVDSDLCDESKAIVLKHETKRTRSGTPDELATNVIKRKRLKKCNDGAVNSIKKRSYRSLTPRQTKTEVFSYAEHVESHEPTRRRKELINMLSCTGSQKCSKLFTNQDALRDHVARCHDKSVKGDGSYCDTCGKFLPNVHQLRKHHDAHHRQIKCKKCDQAFFGTIGLASHRDSVHSQKIPCPKCSKLLPSKVKLEYHLISHMAPEEKKYICEKCGKRFGWSHHLTKHEMNVHVRSRPYKCSVQGCNWAFNDLSNRNMHERRVHKLGPPPKR